MAGFAPSRLALKSILCALVLAWATNAAIGSIEPEFLPRHSTVVLIAGVPGDIESENAYREQLQGWFEVLKGRDPVKLFVLCAQPESIELPSGIAGKALSVDRTNFLQVVAAMAGTTNPVLVVALGHGGRQGSTPVLHVRGPRLTPADFGAFAGRLTQTGSRWIFWFRNSGPFARAVAGVRAVALSSELETAFTSDPVGMPILLKVVRANPEITVEELATKAGKGIGDWYSSRNLARTEEPTLWDGEAKPRALSSKSSEDSVASTSEKGVAADGQDSRAQSEKEEPGPRVNSPTQNASTQLPGSWKEVRKVNEQDYPDADGVILRRAIRCVIGANPAFAAEHDEYIQIVALEGKRFGDFDVSYSPPDEELEFLDCELLRPDGKLIRIDPEAMDENREEAPADYRAGRRRFFSLPQVQPGAVAHVRYRRQWKEFPLPHVAMAVPIESELPALDTTIEVSVPVATPFHFLFEGLPAPNPVIKHSNYSSSYRWHFDKQPAQARENLSAPHQQCALLFSTFADWNAFGQWYARITKLTDEVTPEIASQAETLTRDAKGDLDKVQALYNYVASLRYVAVPLGINSLRPHAAANVLQQQYGDCKDKANLLNALLHSLKMDAQLVLVPRFSHAYDLVPGVGFNHAISRLSVAGQTLWLDTTDDVCRFGLLPPGDPGRKVLVIDGEIRGLTQLPEPDPESHRLRITGELEPADKEETWRAKLTAQAHGYPDYEMREMARETRDNLGALPLLAAKFRPASGWFALQHQTVHAVSDMTADFSWHGEGSFLGISSIAAGKHFLRAPVWLPKEWDAALHERRSPLFLHRGYPLRLDEEFTLTMPEQSAAVVLPACLEGNEPPLRWRVQWTRVGHDKLLAQFHAQLLRGELSWEETVAFQKQLRPLMVALTAEISSASTP
ncbi:MAG TPA: DUF3857 domain-containing transglutaminase family protein [Candidatus Limnocylindrales bacterium]|nr:DUF3857 domain-containing transglutaminase family protein [Candidatus Limnocylindrales bacterium]